MELTIRLKTNPMAADRMTDLRKKWLQNRDGLAFMSLQRLCEISQPFAVVKQLQQRFEKMKRREKEGKDGLPDCELLMPRRYRPPVLIHSAI